jgi:hypothetical protein
MGKFGTGLQSRRRGWMPHVAAVASVATLSLGGCAVSYVGDDGSRHIIGFAKIVIPPADSAMPTAGNVIDLTTIGLSLNDMPEGQSLTLGYSRAVTATLKDNSLVLGNPLAIEEQSHALIEPSTAAVALNAVPAYDGGCAVCALPGADGLR